MARRTDSLDVIEIIAADAPLEWAEELPEHAPAPPSHRSGVRRRVGLAALAVAAVAAAAFAFDDDESTSPTTTTAPIVATTARERFDPRPAAHYLIDDSALTPYSADIVTRPSGTEQVHVYTDGTITGPVVAIELHPFPLQAYGIAGGRRSVVDGIDIVTRGSMLLSEVAIDDDWSATVRGARIDEATLNAVVHAVSVSDGTLAERHDVMAALGLGLTFTADSLDSLLFGAVESTVRYLTTDGAVATLRSAAATPDHRIASLQYLTADPHSSFFERTYGYLLDSGDAVVVWEDDGRLLSLVAPIEAGELARISHHARPASESEWEAMVYGLRPDFRVGEFATLASGTTSAGEQWRAGTQIAHRAGRVEYLWWWTVPGRDGFAASTAASSVVGLWPFAETVVVPGATFVFLAHPNLGGTVTLRTGSGEEHQVRLARAFDRQSIHMAVVHIEEPGPITLTSSAFSMTV